MEKTTQDRLTTNIQTIALLIDKGYDVILKRNRQGDLKIMYYEPKNIKGN